MSEEERRAELVAKLRKLAKSRGLGSSGELFRSYDGDGDQALTRDELDALLRDAGVRAFRGMYVSGIFDKLDKDGDDGLTLAELNGVLRELDPPPPPSSSSKAPKATEPLRTVPFVTTPAERPQETRSGAAAWLILAGLAALVFSAPKGRR